MPSNRYRGNKSIANKINKIDSKLAASEKSAKDPHLSSGIIVSENLNAGAIISDGLAERAVTEDKVARGAIGTEHLGIVNQLTSDSDLRIRAGTGTVIVEGAATGTADIFQVKNSAGTAIHSINYLGHITSSAQPAWSGTLAYTTTATSNFYVGMNASFNIGLTQTNSTTLTVITAGKYLVYAQQLVNTTGGVYFHITQNGGTVNYAYSNADDTYDVVVGALLDCAAGATIRMYYSGGSVAYAWGDAHSRLTVYKVS